MDYESPKALATGPRHNPFENHVATITRYILWLIGFEFNVYLAS